MTAAQVGFLCGLIWFIIFMAGHVGAIRRRPAMNRSRVLAVGILLCAAGAVITVGVLPLGSQLAVLLAVGYAVVVIGCLFVLYGPFFYAVHTSVSIDTLLLLGKHGGRAPMTVVTERYCSPRIVEERLATMVRGGYLIDVNGRFHLTARGKLVATAFKKIKTAWRLGAGG